MNSEFLKRNFNDQQLSQYYSVMNSTQKQYTQINESSMDLFVLLDISGSMNQTSNKFLNFGAGFIQKSFLPLNFLTGGLISLDKATFTKMFNTRLDEAKKHLVEQIQNLISEKEFINLVQLLSTKQQELVQVQHQISKKQQMELKTRELLELLHYMIQFLMLQNNQRTHLTLD